MSESKIMIIDILHATSVVLNNIDFHTYFKAKTARVTKAKPLLLNHIIPKNHKKPIELDTQIRRRLKDYFLKTPQKKQPFDCANFIHFLHGIPYEFGNFEREKWDFCPFFYNWELQIGDSIAIGNPLALAEEDDGSNLTHMALYLGENIYLSKFGYGGGLIFATLPEMKRGFGGECQWKIKPSNNMI